MVLNAQGKLESTTVKGQYSDLTHLTPPPSNLQDEHDQTHSTRNAQSYREVADAEAKQTAGRTIDFTILVSVRAAEALVLGCWAYLRRHTIKLSRSRRLVEWYLHEYIDSGIFALSAGIVM